MGMEESVVFEFERGLCSGASERLCDAFGERFDGEWDGENEGRVEFDRDLSGKESTLMRNPGSASVGVGAVDDVEDMPGVANAASELGMLGRGGKVDWEVSGMAGDGARDMLPERSAVCCGRRVVCKDCRCLCARLYCVYALYSSLLFSSLLFSSLFLPHSFCQMHTIPPNYPLIKLYRESRTVTYFNYVTHIQYVTAKEMKILCVK